MGLLDKLQETSQKVGGFSAGLGQLSTMAKAAFCLPSIISGALNSLPSVISGTVNGVVSGIANSLEDIVNTVVGTVNQTIQGVADRINGLVSQAQSLLGQIAGTTQRVLDFVDEVKAAIDDVADFVSSKENCNFAGAALGKCIVQSTLLNFTGNELSSISGKGTNLLQSAEDFVSGPDSPLSSINGFVNKQTTQLNRASKMVNKFNNLF